MNCLLVFCAVIAAASANACGAPEIKQTCAQGVYRVNLENQPQTCLKPLPPVYAPTIRTKPITYPVQNIGSSCRASNVQYESAPQFASALRGDNSYSVVSESAVPSSIAVSSVSASNYDRTKTYKVAVDNCGPKSKPLRPINAPPKVVKPIEAAPVTLPFKVPSPKTVSNSCKCVKTIVKPQVVQQLVVVPVVRKYVQTLARPVYERINYNAEPINCPKTECYC